MGAVRTAVLAGEVLASRLRPEPVPAQAELHCHQAVVFQLPLKAIQRSPLPHSEQEPKTVQRQSLSTLPILRDCVSKN